MSISGIPRQRQSYDIELLAAPDEPGHIGLTVAFIAASAVGKSYIARNLVEEGLVHPTPTWTTRPPRPGETDTEYDHVFVDTETFREKQSIGGFALTGTLYGHEYGLPVLQPSPDERPHLVVLKDSVVEPFRELYPCSKVFQLESGDGLDRMKAAMRERDQDEQDISARIEDYPREVEHGRQVADRVFYTPDKPHLILDEVREAVIGATIEHTLDCPAVNFLSDEWAFQ